MIDILHTMPVLFLVAVGILGLIVGSFLTVVIYRLPLVLQRQWRGECREFLRLLPESPFETFNLVLPRSQCPHCKHSLKVWHNIPVFSYLWLRGKCGFCKRHISARYPLVEISSAVLSVIVAWHFGLSWQTLAALIFTWSLLALTYIDLEQQILPDNITLPLLWLGLLLSLNTLFIDSHTALIAAAAGYFSLWLVAYIFHCFTGKIGMGQGDFKLLAAIGAWTGWVLLPLVVLLAALLGSIVGFSLLASKKHKRGIPISFGPYLAIAGWIALIWGDKLVKIYLYFGS